MKPKDCPAAVLTTFAGGGELDADGGTEVSVGTMSFSPSSAPKITGFTLGDSTTTVDVGDKGTVGDNGIVDVVDVVDVVEVVEVVDVVVVVEVVVVTAVPAPVNRTTGENNRCCTSEILTALIPAIRAS